LTQTYPEATVGALVVNGKGEVLIVRSHKWGDKFTVPGGHIELGERAEDAIRREVKEETGLDAEPVELLIVQQAIYPEDFYRRDHYIFMDYVCRTIKPGQPVRLDGVELQHYRWVRPEEALKLDLEHFTRNFVVKYLEERAKWSKT
jgi:nucleoside triphosphatase